jgi:hypothetical protein
VAKEQKGKRKGGEFRGGLKVREDLKGLAAISIRALLMNETLFGIFYDLRHGMKP